MTEIKVEVKDVTGSLYLKQHLGNGSLGKTKFDASLILPTMGMLVSVGDKQYLVDSQSLISAMIKHHESTL